LDFNKALKIGDGLRHSDVLAELVPVGGEDERIL